MLLLCPVWIRSLVQQVGLWLGQRKLIYFVRGSIIVQLSSCFMCLVSAVLLAFYEQPIYMCGQVKPVQHEVSCAYSDTSPYEASWSDQF